MENEEKADLHTDLGAAPVGGTIQIGTVVAYLGTSAPQDWLLCNGAAIPEQYGQLKALFGSNTPNLAGRTLIGTGIPANTTQSDGTTPNFDAADNWPMSYTGGEYNQTLNIQQIPSHQHFGWGDHGRNNWGVSGYSSGQGYTGSHNTDSDNSLFGSTFAGGQYAEANPAVPTISVDNGSVAGTAPGTTAAHNNMQPYYAVNYIVYAGTN